MNNLGGVYTTGTITIAVGGVSVTGVGTLWTPIAEVGDWILCNGQVGLILTVNGDTLLTLQTPWQGTLPSGATYVLIKMSWLRYEPALMQAKLRELLAELEGAGNFIFTAVDPPDPALGQDGDFALKTDVVPWQLWLKTGGVWVEQAPAGSAIVDDQVTPPMLDADTAAKQEAFRTRLYAAPFDALAYNGMQINGSMGVHQSDPGAYILLNNVQSYILDGWTAACFGTYTVNAAQIANSPSGFQRSLDLIMVTPGTPAVGDIIIATHPIEGYRVARLDWGTANARPITIGFWVFCAAAGTYSGAVQNGAANRSYAFSFTVGASVWTYITVTVPGDTTGTWSKGNTVGMQIRFALSAGSSYQTTSGVWTAGNFVGATGTFNGGASGGEMRLTGVTVLPGTQAPTAAQSPLIMRPYDQELVTCQRYWRRMKIRYSGPKTAGVGFMLGLPLAPHMRAAPTISVFTYAHVGVDGAVSRASDDATVIEWFTPVASGSLEFNEDVNLDARL